MARCNVLASSTAIALATLLFGTAYAQDEPEPEAGDTEGVSDDELAGDLFDESDGLHGSDENPDDPDSTFADKDEAVKVTAGEVPTEYPIEAIYRPLTLPKGMSQLVFSLPLNFDPFGVALAVEGDYGITKKIQVGLRYGLGRYSEEFSVGKAIALDARYLITNDISAEVSLPLYLDPFAMGLAVGVPMRFEFFDTFALTFGRDLLNLRLVEFFPSVENATQNDAFILAKQSNTVLPRYIMNLTAGAIYQMKPNVALDVQLGTSFDDEPTSASRTVAALGILFSKSNMLDFGGRISAADLSQLSETLTLNLFANWRI